MSIERTLAILKPDAVRDGHIGEIISIIEKNGLHIAAMKQTVLTPEQVEAFYYVHHDRYFFPMLCEMMMEGPVVVMVLQGDNASSRWREIIGATDPAEARPGTVRQMYGESIQHNAVHGSDCPDSAGFEITFFFSGAELL